MTLSLWVIVEKFVICTLSGYSLLTFFQLCNKFVHIYRGKCTHYELYVYRHNHYSMTINTVITQPLFFLASHLAFPEILYENKQQ
jgi:hypothetical protein